MYGVTPECVIRISKEDAKSVLAWSENIKTGADVGQVLGDLRGLSDAELAFHFDFEVVLPHGVGVTFVEDAEVARASWNTDLGGRHVPDYCCMLCGQVFKGDSPKPLQRMSDHVEEHANFFQWYVEYGILDIFVEIDVALKQDISFMARTSAGEGIGDLSIWENIRPAIVGPICPQARPELPPNPF